MKIATKNIFLAGGGSVADSRSLDERFAAAIDATKPLVYIPNAMKSRPYKSCLAWLESVLSPLGITNIEMWVNLRRRYPEVTSIAGVYIGGGDTIKLLQEIRKVEFDNYLLQVINAGLPVYGGSAGAIILGRDIRTAPEAHGLNIAETKGLEATLNYSIVCHYASNRAEEVQNLAQQLGHGIIAIPEKAGGHLYSNHLTNYGTEPISIFREKKITLLNPYHAVELPTGRSSEPTVKLREIKEKGQ